VVAKARSVLNGEWTAEDSAAVRQIREGVQAEHPGINSHTAHQRARKVYYEQTRKVYSHGLSGFDAGCKCTTCKVARSAHNKAQRAAHAH